MKFGKMMGSKLLDEKWGVERYSMKADNIEKIISDTRIERFYLMEHGELENLMR